LGFGARLRYNGSMRTGILSDIHDHLDNLGAAIRFLNSAAPDALICCGDLCSPFVVDELKKFAGTVHIVFGNNDADLFRITRKCDARVQAHGEFLESDLGGRRIAVNHFDYIARPIAASGRYDLVCFGHNHRISLEQEGRTVLANPGPIMGVAFGSQGWERVASTFMVYDTSDGSIEAYEIAPGREAERFRV
jgi:putative phosphoesterase